MKTLDKAWYHHGCKCQWHHFWGGISFLWTDIKGKLKSVITLNYPSWDINIITSQKHWFPHHNQIVCDLWNIEDSTRRPPQSNNCKWRGGPPKYSSFDEIVKNFWAHYNLHHLWNMQHWTLFKIGCCACNAVSKSKLGGFE